MKVAKKSGNPFKSGLKINRVNDVIIHPITKRPAYIFDDDDSYVEVRMCVVVI